VIAYSAPGALCQHLLLADGSIKSEMPCVWAGRGKIVSFQSESDCKPSV
jgi:hypothetical protein